MPPRSKSETARPARVEPGEGVLDKILAKLPDALERAQTNGGQAARATIEALNNTIRTQEGALKSAYDQIGKYEQVCQHLLGAIGSLQKTNAEATKIDSDERVRIAGLTAEAEFKKHIVDALAPAAPPALLAFARKLGLMGPDDSLLLNASGGEIEADRAAFWETINTIAVRPDLQSALSEAVGVEKWSRTMQHLQREFMAAQAKAVNEQAKTNGVSN